jgi:hypothetical protein
MAYKIYPSVKKGSLTKEDFGGIMKRVGGLTLSPGQLDLIFHLYDKVRVLIRLRYNLIHRFT